MKPLLAILVACLAPPMRGLAADSDSIAVTASPAPSFHPKHFVVGTAAGLALDLGLVQLFKATDHQWRPDYSDQRSLPSRHAAVAWNLSTALSRELIPHNPLWAPALQLGASALSQQRIIARRHHSTDISAGMMIGIGTNLLGNAIANWCFGSPRAYPAGRDIVPLTGLNITVSSAFCAAVAAGDMDEASTPPYDGNGTPIDYAEINGGMSGYGTLIDVGIPLQKENLFFDIELGLSSYLLRIDHLNYTRYTGVNASQLAIGISYQKTSGQKRPGTFQIGALLGARLWNSSVDTPRLSHYAAIRLGYQWYVQPRLSVGFLYDFSLFSFRPFNTTLGSVGSSLALTTRYYLR